VDTAAGVAQAIPYSAWEQAVFVALFVVLLTVMLIWSSKSQKDWQDFIYKRDQDWHGWMDKSNATTNAFMDRVTCALDKLTQSLEDHDDKVEVRFEQATQLMSKPVTRKKADADK
jgi:hypothetical protein